MNKFELVLFDLDGTLTDPKIGITNSVMYALKKLGYKVPKREEILFFIGPPLLETFSEYLNVDFKEAARLVSAYREYFSVNGLFENELIDGAKELLQKLKKDNKKIALATSKPKIYADKILEHFGLMEYFDITVGSNLDGTLTDKGEVIKKVLYEFPNIEKKRIAMVGDRSYDMLGAVKNKIIPIGVLCGYGDENELIKAGAEKIFENLIELKEQL